MEHENVCKGVISENWRENMQETRDTKVNVFIIMWNFPMIETK